MTLRRCLIRMKAWRQLMLVAGIGCFVAATAWPSWAQVPGVPPVPDQTVEAETDAATNAAAAADAAANAGADATTNIEAGAENAANATTQADAAAEAATDAAPGAQGEINARGNVDANADTQAPRLQGDADVDAEANARNRPGEPTDARVGVDTQTRLGAAAEMQDGRLVLGNVTSQSLAARAGLRASDEIVSINGTQIRTRAAYDTAIRDTVGPATIQYRRGGQLYTTRVNLPPAPQRQQSFYRGADAVQSGNAAQKYDSPVQKGGGYYDADCSNGGGRQGNRRQRRGYR